MEGLHEVDPRGDVIITLRNLGAPFAEDARWPTLVIENSRKKKKKRGKGW